MPGEILRDVSRTRKKNEEKGPPVSGSVRRSLPANPPDENGNEMEDVDVEDEEPPLGSPFRMPGEILRDVSRTSDVAASMDGGASGTSGDGDSSQVLDANGGTSSSQSLDSSRTESEGEPNRTSTPREPRDQFPLRERDTNTSDAGTAFMKCFGMSCIMKMFFTFVGSFFVHLLRSHTDYLSLRLDVSAGELQEIKTSTLGIH